VWVSNFNIIVVIGVVLEIFSTAFASFTMRCVGRGLLSALIQFLLVLPTQNLVTILTIFGKFGIPVKNVCLPPLTLYYLQAI
jgi:hypothetical protein